jgi:hypothetical protein
MNEKKLNIVDLWFEETGTLVPNVGTARIFPNARYQSAVLAKFENTLPTDVVEVLYHLPNGVDVEPVPMLYSGQYLYKNTDYTSFINQIPEQVTAFYKRDRDVVVKVGFKIRRFDSFLGYVVGTSGLEPYTTDLNTNDLIFVISDIDGVGGKYFKFYETVQDAIDGGVQVVETSQIPIVGTPQENTLYLFSGSQYFVWSPLFDGGYVSFGEGEDTRWIDTGTEFGGVPQGAPLEAVFGTDIVDVVISKGLPYQGKMTTISQVDTILMLIASIRGEMGAIVNVNSALEGATLVAKINDLYLKHLAEIARLDGEVDRLDGRIDDERTYVDDTFLKKAFEEYFEITSITQANEDLTIALRDKNTQETHFITMDNLEKTLYVLADKVVDGSGTTLTDESRVLITKAIRDRLLNINEFGANEPNSYLYFNENGVVELWYNGAMISFQFDGQLAFGENGEIQIGNHGLMSVGNNYVQTVGDDSIENVGEKKTINAKNVEINSTNKIQTNIQIQYPSEMNPTNIRDLTPKKYVDDNDAILNTKIDNALDLGGDL